MQFLRRSLTGLFLLTVTLGLLAYAGSVFFSAVEERMNRENRVRPAEERVFPVNTLEVVSEDTVPVITAFGAVQSRRILELRSSVSGKIVDLSENFEAGASVAVGDLLARIDPKDAQSALEVARTDLAEAEEELADAERNLELVRDELTATQAQAELRSQALKRQVDLARRGVGTEAAVETAALAEASANQAVVGRRMAEAAAENRKGQAVNRVNRARIALADAERTLEDTELRAAFSGTLADVAVVKGGLVNQNERLATLIDPEALEVAFRLSTIQYARLLDASGNLVKAPVLVSLDVQGLDLQATGRITRVDATVGEGQTGRLIFARLDSSAGIRPGDFVTVRIEEPKLNDVAVLPASAVDATETVLAVGADGRLDVVPIDLLRRQADNVIVSAPELDGRRVVVERTPLLGPGVLIRDLSQGGDAIAGVNGNGSNGGGPGGETIELSPERRAALIAAVESNTRMPPEAKERVLSQLRQERVSRNMVERIESRTGG